MEARCEVFLVIFYIEIFVGFSSDSLPLCVKVKAVTAPTNLFYIL